MSEKWRWQFVVRLYETWRPSFNQWLNVGRWWIHVGLWRGSLLVGWCWVDARHLVFMYVKRGE